MDTKFPCDYKQSPSYTKSNNNAANLGHRNGAKKNMAVPVERQKVAEVGSSPISDKTTPGLDQRKMSSRKSKKVKDL